MKKIFSLIIVALLSLAVLTACGHNSVSTTPPEVVETTEETKHPDWDPTYTLLEYSGVKQESAKTIQDESEFQSEVGEKRFEHWVVFDSRNINCGAQVITIDGMPFQVVGYDLYDPSISLQEYLNGSEYAVWDLRSVQDTETDEVFEWLYYTYEENSFNTTFDNYGNFV